jgi:hypothetical protein
MAIIANQLDSKLKLVFNAGIDEENKDIMKNKTFANVKPAVTNENLYNLAVSMSDLQSYTLSKIVRYEEYQISSEI